MSSKYDSYLTPNSTPTKLPKSQRSRQRREPSGVFSLFQPNQVQLFREAFSLVDHDADGVITEQDLKHIFASLGMYDIPCSVAGRSSALGSPSTDAETFRPFMNHRYQRLEATD